MALQPRFTGTLRALFFPQDGSFDLHKAQASREKRLARLKKRNVVEETGSGTLTWSSFVRGANDTESNKRSMRAKYSEFLKRLQDVVGDDVMGAELNEKAHFTFQVLVNAELDGPEKLKRLKQLVGPIKEQTAKEMEGLCVALEAWRSSVVPRANSNDEDGVLSTSATERRQQQAPRAFGSDLVVSLEAPDFLSEPAAPRFSGIEVVRNSAAPSSSKVASQVPAQSKGRVEVVKHSATWLESECEKYANVRAVEGIDINPSDLSRSIAAILQTTSGDAELQAQLFDLLGIEGMELMGSVLENRVDIIRSLRQYQKVEAAHSTVGAAGRAGPSMVGSITVTLESDKKAEKRLRKQQRKLRQHMVEVEEKPATSEADMQRYARAIESGDRSLIPVVAKDNYTPAASNSSAFGEKFKLPEGGRRTDTKKYEEVFLPYKLPPYRSDDSLVPISEFDKWAQPAFKGYKSLNRIQSAVFNSAYYSNENLLICAPTGAGKTNIAMTCILREVGQNMEEGELQRDQFKVVYVAPMKALAAEMTAGFGKRLRALGLKVRELTGDMQLTKREIQETQMIVTTPEKYDVITRKSSDDPLASLVRLLIIDEVHLLNEDRGPVIETIVARTLRQVETSQSMIRIVGLSATLPNYKDVAAFLRVNPDSGLHYFDATYRPVPLEQTFIGVKAKSYHEQNRDMDRIAYEKVVRSLKAGNQCMIFVHSRKKTAQTADALMELAREEDQTQLFQAALNEPKFGWARKDIGKTRNSELKRVFSGGFGIHHAGMLRSDRNLVEKLFMQGVIKVLCCTATLAWGVNLPSRTVIIKGTQLYNAEKGSFVQLGMLDVMQIFGRAGRPQFDNKGEAIMITTHDQLYRYLALTNQQMPIESQFISNLADHLNAETVLGTVSNVDEAVTWISYTYLYIRMLKNPLAYGITAEEKRLDPLLVQKRTELVVAAANLLDDVRMMRFNNPFLNSTSLGQIASHFYILHETIRTFNEAFAKKGNSMRFPEIFKLIASASEFENLKTREEELPELDRLKRACPVKISGDASGDKSVKVNVLLQAYISRAETRSFALICDTNYVAQNAARIARGLFEISLKKGWPDAASLLLTLCKMIDLRIWHTQHPLRQFPHINRTLIYKFEQQNVTLDRILDMTKGDLSSLTRTPAASGSILSACHQIPYLEIDATVQPITRSIIRVRVSLIPDFTWHDRVHGSVQPFWVWVENPEEVGILHHEHFLLRKRESRDATELVFTIPITHPPPPQYVLHVCADRWLGSDNSYPLSFKHLILPRLYPPHTKLLELHPLPRSVLGDAKFESIFSYSHFNPIQTQIFHTVFHTDENVLLGAPTGSGKTVAAELAVLRLARHYPHLKAVYLGPLKALVRERLKDWKRKFVDKMGMRMVELTGEFTPDVMALKSSNIICTTPEKWDGVSRSWQNRSYVKSVGLVIIDEIHLLGEDRGPILEVIVSRMRYISSQTENPIRVVGLSTALANAKDLGDWLGIEGPGLFNFHPSVRPVPLKIHVQGYEGKHYCPRMAKMNKPCYAAIQTYCPRKPTLIFVSSRRQTRLTALDLMTYLSGDGYPKKWVHMEEEELQEALQSLRDANLRHTVSFGIGLHHAGLPRADRDVVERLFGAGKIQVLVSTATLAWGVNLPASLCIIKGGEYFDPKTHRYADYAITDMLQMMGRAGRPQFDDVGQAVIMVKNSMKGFYKKFLYEPFPVESSLADVLHDHFNAEIVGGTITTKHDAVDYLTWTYLFRRILVNPTYYGLENAELPTVNKFLSELVDDALYDLEASNCIEMDEDNFTIWPLTMGKIISYYYLNHMTARLFFEEIEEDSSCVDLLRVLSSAAEYAELPVRHNEDKINEELAEDRAVRWELPHEDYEDPHLKANILLQCHFSRTILPISDYITDTRSVLDQAIRILQAMIDVAADAGWLWAAVQCMELVQMVVQAQWNDQSTLYQLPHMNRKLENALRRQGVHHLAQLVEMQQQALQSTVAKATGRGRERHAKSIVSAVRKFPVLDMRVALREADGVAVKEMRRGGGSAKLQVKLRRAPKSGGPKSMGRAYTPMFPKQKREGWWVVVGDAEDGELLALKRVTVRSTRWQTATLDFSPYIDDDELEDDIIGIRQAAEEAPLVERRFVVYVVSDTYLGLDLQEEFTVMVEEEETDDEEESE